MSDQTEHKHILLIGPAFPFRGGIAHFIESMYAAFKNRGHKVSVVSFTRQYPSILFPGKSQYESDSEDAVSFAIPLIDSINPLSWFKTARYICNLKPDAVVFNYWLPFFAPAFGLIASRLKKAGIPVIGLVHNALPHERRPGDITLSRYFLSKCDGLLVMSESVSKDIKQLGVSLPQKMTGHPVYSFFGEPVHKAEARKTLALSLDVPVILFFGFIRRYKGLHVLLDSMAEVAKQLPDIQLLVAGECYEDEAAYVKKISDNHLEANIHFHTDYIPGDQVKNYFCAADLVVQPYLSATQSGVAQIAYHFERPLIVTDVGGLAELVPHEVAGLVIPPDDANALSMAIIRFFKERMGDKLVIGVQSQKKKYSWTRLCDSIEHLAGFNHT